MARKVHSTGNVSRSDGNDTDCGASSDDPSKLLLANNDSEVTCKRCQKILRTSKKPSTPQTNPYRGIPAAAEYQRYAAKVEAPSSDAYGLGYMQVLRHRQDGQDP